MRSRHIGDNDFGVNMFLGYDIPFNNKQSELYSMMMKCNYDEMLVSITFIKDHFKYVD